MHNIYGFFLPALFRSMEQRPRAKPANILICNPHVAGGPWGFEADRNEKKVNPQINLWAVFRL